MHRHIEKIMPVPLAFGILAAVLLVLLLDYRGLGRVERGLEPQVSKEAAAEWLTRNRSGVLKGVQSLLFGTDAWVASLDESNLVFVKVFGLDRPSDRTVIYNIEQEAVRGTLEIDVDLRTSASAAVGASVASVRLVGVGPKVGEAAPKSDTIYASKDLTRGRVRYFLNVLSSIVWHLVIAGILFGVARRAPAPPKLVMALCLAAAMVIVNYFSASDHGWRGGSLALGALALAWGASEFIRRKRHLEVLRLIISE